MGCPRSSTMCPLDEMTVFIHRPPRRFSVLAGRASRSIRGRSAPAMPGGMGWTCMRARRRGREGAGSGLRTPSGFWRTAAATISLPAPALPPPRR
jgi:hypothetical protein